MRPIDYEAEVDRYLADKPRRDMREREERDAGMSSLSNPEEWLLQAILGRVASATGITVTPLRMMGVATVFACVRLRAEVMASLPLILYRRDGKGGIIEARDHPLYSIMQDAPNKEMSAYDFISTMEGHLSLRQNAFAEIIRDSDGDPIGLYPIDPMDISVVRDSRTMNIIYKFMRNGTDFRMEDILHLKGYSRSGLIGVDMSTNLQEVFALAIALQDNAAKFFGNGSRPGAVLEHPKVLGAEAQKRLVDQMDQSTSGRNLYRTLVLEEGMKWTKQRSENKDSQFQEARDFQNLEICRVFRTPPHKVGITAGMPRANVEEENISFVTDAITPNCVNWEKKLDLSMLTMEEREQGLHFKFNIDALLRGNMKARYEAYGVGRQWGFLNVNDILRREGMNPCGPEGEIRLQPSNMVPLGTLPAPNTPGKADTAAEETEAPDGEADDGNDNPPAAGAKKPAKPAVKAGKGGNPTKEPPDKTIPTLPGKPKEIAVVEDSSILKV